jgi:hypothetical protein
LFFNRSKANWRDNENFVFWSTGDVLESPDELPAALARAVAEPMRYRAEQERAFNEAFDLTDTPSSVRAADAIMGFLAREGL